MTAIRTHREERAEANRIPVFTLLRSGWRQLRDLIRRRKEPKPPRFFAGPDAERRR